MKYQLIYPGYKLEKTFWNSKNVVSHIGLGKIEAPWVDFAIITLCDHHIIGVGTFVLTSAFLGRGTIVYDPTQSYVGPRIETLQDPSIYIPIYSMEYIKNKQKNT